MNTNQKAIVDKILNHEEYDELDGPVKEVIESLSDDQIMGPGQSAVVLEACAALGLRVKRSEIRN